MTVVTVAPRRRAPEAPWTPDEAASNGAVFLDEQRPGWADEVDPDTLRIDRSCDCVLGQTYGYFDGVRLLGLGDATPMDAVGTRIMRLGFYAETFEQYADLTVAWKREIVARREKP